MKLNLTEIEEFLIDDQTKGIPGGCAPFRLRDIGKKGWNLLSQDLPLPAAVIKQSALTHNSRWMRRFLEVSGCRICPHGKTTMSPQLFDLQLRDGAWGITAATVSQIQVYRRYSVKRILLANQLLGLQSVRFVLDELRRDPEFDFYCLVDSVPGVEILATALRRDPIGRPLQVLLEGGQLGGRTGVRTFEQGMDVAHAVKATEPLLALRGVEGFEGVLKGKTAEETEGKVRSMFRFLSELALECTRQRLFSGEPVILTAGGSAYYDLAAAMLSEASLGSEFEVVLRSGCYLTHDSKAYSELFERLQRRSPQLKELGSKLQPAIEVWAYVQSRPEPLRAIATLGKRDVSFDLGMPLPDLWYRSDVHSRPHRLPDGHRVSALNDQHAYLDVPEDSPLQVGDMLGFGISHPCTTFDKWRLIPLVDEDYKIVSAVMTFF